MLQECLQNAKFCTLSFHMNQIYLKLFVNHFQFALNLKTLICSILPKTQNKLILGRESTHLQFASIYFGLHEINCSNSIIRGLQLQITKPFCVSIHGKPLSHLFGKPI